MVEKIATKIKNNLEPKKIKENTSKFEKAVRTNMATAMVAAFGFIMALVWRDAIQSIIDKILLAFDLTGETYIFKIISAILITIISVLGILYFSKYVEKEEEPKKKSR